MGLSSSAEPFIVANEWAADDEGAGVVKPVSGIKCEMSQGGRGMLKLICPAYPSKNGSSVFRRD